MTLLAQWMSEIDPSDSDCVTVEVVYNQCEKYHEKISFVFNGYHKFQAIMSSITSCINKSEWDKAEEKKKEFEDLQKELSEDEDIGEVFNTDMIDPIISLENLEFSMEKITFREKVMDALKKIYEKLMAAMRRLYAIISKLVKKYVFKRKSMAGKVKVLTPEEQKQKVKEEMEEKEEATGIKDDDAFVEEFHRLLEAESVRPREKEMPLLWNPREKVYIDSLYRLTKELAITTEMINNVIVPFYKAIKEELKSEYIKKFINHYRRNKPSHNVNTMSVITKVSDALNKDLHSRISKSIKASYEGVYWPGLIVDVPEYKEIKKGNKYYFKSMFGNAADKSSGDYAKKYSKYERSPMDSDKALFTIAGHEKINEYMAIYDKYHDAVMSLSDLMESVDKEMDRVDKDLNKYIKDNNDEDGTKILLTIMNEMIRSVTDSGATVAKLISQVDTVFNGFREINTNSHSISMKVVSELIKRNLIDID